jgi:hypothetical protein
VSSILSAISGQFSKSLILGTFFPVALFVTLNALFLVPLLPTDWQLQRELADVGTGDVLIVSLMVIVLTGLLYNLNGPIIRFYEGYPWADSWLGRWRKRHYQEQWRLSTELRPRAQDLDNVLGRRTPPAGLSPEARAAWLQRKDRLGWLRTQLGQQTRRLPEHEDSVLPTHLGNLIRSFENYPHRQYKMAAITLWPRLLSVVGKEYIAFIDDAKTSLDFMLHCSALSALTALLLLVAGLLYPAALRGPALWLPWLLKILAAAALAHLFYLSSLGRAAEWGDFVKSAFDLYRWDLLKQLGYEREPSSAEEERELWDAISLQLVFGLQPQQRRPVEYKLPASSPRRAPVDLQYEFARGVKPTAQTNVFEVTLRARNVDSQERAARRFILRDTLPAGCDYVWDSARYVKLDATVAERAPADTDATPNVTGTNPYQFEVGGLAHMQRVVLTYRALRHKD